MNIRCMIVDDEPLAREGMELLVNDVGFLHLAAQCCNAMEASEVLAAQKIDLIFLDIQMPKIRGIDFIKSLTTRPLVIITTAYPNFALEGFELNVLDYLVKPITPERFLKAVNRARELMEYKQGGPGSVDDTYFFIKCSQGYEKIFYADILFIEASQNYVTLYTNQGKYMTLATMKGIEEQLPQGRFLRIQKSYIVALGKIQSFINNEVVIGPHKLPVSKSYRDELMQLIDQKLIKK
ncbi:LytTR family DNA-binding domain-containing protein [uncultured Chitinophaga sp.]|uniref:LytR/AlgR family response regulator transcription factor n=1 Tax=uncultured Chitinophaga sp. TaxID=339340 RepID=UPI0025F29402|nr:LytTR family DNA-binding domain-containing protein [uncultured Chitinophaga sp.]